MSRMPEGRPSNGCGVVVSAERRWRRQVRAGVFLACAALGVGALAGCQRASNAASVQGSGVSISTVNRLVSEASRDDTVSHAAGGNNDQLREAVLQNQIRHLAIARLTQGQGFTVTNGEVQQFGSVLDQLARQNRLTAATVLAQQGVPAAAAKQYYTDALLAGDLAAKRNLDSGEVSSYGIGVLLVAPGQVARVRDQLGDPKDFPALATRYSDPSAPRAVQSIDPATLQQNLVQIGVSQQQIANVAPGDTFSYPDPNSGKALLVHIYTAQQQKFGTLSKQEQIVALAVGDTQDSLIRSSGLHVSVNPRFGAWDAKTGKLTTLQPAAVTLPTASSSSASPTP